MKCIQCSIWHRVINRAIADLYLQPECTLAFPFSIAQSPNFCGSRVWSSPVNNLRILANAYIAVISAPHPYLNIDFSLHHWDDPCLTCHCSSCNCCSNQSNLLHSRGPQALLSFAGKQTSSSQQILYFAIGNRMKNNSCLQLYVLKRFLISGPDSLLLAISLIKEYQTKRT